MNQIVTSIAFVLFMYQPMQASSEGRVESDSATSLIANKWNIHLSYVAGYKRLEEGWTPARHQFEFGLVDFDFGKTSWPMSICAQLLLSYSPVVPRLQEVTGDYSGVYECNFGIRKVFRLEGPIRPHAAAGFGILGVATTTRIQGFGYYQEENKSAVGYWANAGFYWIFSDANFTGVSFEYSKAHTTLFNQRIEVGGIHILLYFGWSW